MPPPYSFKYMGETVALSTHNSFSFLSNHSSYTQCCPPWAQHVWGEGWEERTLSATESSCPPETQNSEVWAQEAQVQENTPFRPRGEGVSPSFSQNPKQVLFMPEFWCVRKQILRHPRLCLVAGKYLEKAPQLPTPCTFPSAVSGSSWVSFAAWVMGM